jgi:hypothetical protein
VRAAPAALPKAVQQLLVSAFTAPCETEAGMQHTRTLVPLMLLLYCIPAAGVLITRPHQIKGSNLGVGLCAKVPASKQLFRQMSAAEMLTGPNTL